MNEETTRNENTKFELSEQEDNDIVENKQKEVNIPVQKDMPQKTKKLNREYTTEDFLNRHPRAS